VCVHIGEKVVSNLARFVVVVWCFVVLVLTQSYTANLTSFLTVQRFQPAAINVKDLIKNGDYVGYQHGAFVKDFLIKEGFNVSKLKPFGSSEECHALLSNGSISAAFDEVAYLRAILSQYCSKYAIVEPTFKTAGFGFVSFFFFSLIYENFKLGKKKKDSSSIHCLFP